MRILDPIIYFINSPILQPKRYQSVANTLARIGLLLKHNGRVYCIIGWCETIYCKTLSDVENKINPMRKAYYKLFHASKKEDFCFDTKWRQNERY